MAAIFLLFRELKENEFIDLSFIKSSSEKHKPSVWKCSLPS